MVENLEMSTDFLRAYPVMESTSPVSSGQFAARIDPSLTGNEMSPQNIIKVEKMEGNMDLSPVPLLGLDDGSIVGDPQLAFLRGSDNDWQVQDPDSDCSFGAWP